MPITGTKQSFTKENVEKAPEQAGVYGLYDGTETIYYGSSDKSIRARLKSHKDGLEGTGTQNAGQFNWEVTARALEREKELLDEHKRVAGKLPKCNAVVP